MQSIQMLLTVPSLISIRQTFRWLFYDAGTTDYDAFPVLYLTAINMLQDDILRFQVPMDNALSV